MPTSSYCTPSGLACVAKVVKQAIDCKTPCTGVFADVFRADDTKLTTDMMKLANLMHDLANEGGPQLHYDITLNESSRKTGGKQACKARRCDSNLQYETMND